jgi:hypothetical protein
MLRGGRAMGRERSLPRRGCARLDRAASLLRDRVKSAPETHPRFARAFGAAWARSAAPARVQAALARRLGIGRAGRESLQRGHRRAVRSIPAPGGDTAWAGTLQGTRTRLQHRDRPGSCGDKGRRRRRVREIMRPLPQTAALVAVCAAAAPINLPL